MSMTCLAALMSNALAQSAVAQPETETFTFGVLVNFTGADFLDLSEVIGEDTNGIFIGKYIDGASGVLSFAGIPSRLRWRGCCRNDMGHY